MSAFDPATALETLATEYAARENAGDDTPRRSAARCKDSRCPIPSLPACAWRQKN